MIPYSHIVVAAQLEPLLSPAEPAEYYWGTVAADMRYPAGVARSQTHLAPEQISAYAAKFPLNKSFLQGYLVHCLADEVDLKVIFGRQLPFLLFKRQLYRSRLAIILEMYHFEQQGVDRQVSGRYNPVLAELGLSEAVCTKFAQSMNIYMKEPTPEGRFSTLFKMMGMVDEGKENSYKSAAERLQKNTLLKGAMFAGIRYGKICEKIVAEVEGMARKCIIGV